VKANFTLAPIFTDNMIFQAGKSVLIFGTCQKRREIRVRMCGNTYRFKTTDLSFCFELPALPYLKTPFDVEIACKNQTVTLHDCLSGEVFLLAGQANMAFPLRDTYETRVRENRLIRFFEVPRMPYPNANLEFPDLYSAKAGWRTCEGMSAMEFSAIGNHVAQYLFEDLDVPIGIISCCQNDTSIFSWAGMLELCELPGLARYLSNYRQEVAKYKSLDEYCEKFNKTLPVTLELYQEFRNLEKSGTPSLQIFEKLSKKRQEFLLPMGPKHPNRPAGTFETMVKPIVPFPVKAVLFYQGESDADHGELYEAAFKAMVKSWRRVLGEPALPFVFVQIAGSAYAKLPETASALVREAQGRCVSFLNNIYMASAVDLGEENNLHPRDKAPISRRIANVVLEKIFRKGKNSMSPAYFSYSSVEGQITIFTEFNNLNLVSRSNQFRGFKVSYDGETFVDCDCVGLMNSQIVIRSAKKIREIRYCFVNYPHCDIYTTNDLPLLPFRIRLEP